MRHEIPKDEFERSQSGEIFGKDNRLIRDKAAHFVTEVARSDQSKRFNESMKESHMAGGREIEGRNNALYVKGEQPSESSLRAADNSFSKAAKYREGARVAGLEADSAELHAAKHFNANAPEYIQTAREEAAAHGVEINLPLGEQQAARPDAEAHQGKAA